MRFDVKLGNEIVGFSDLEFGDASMGCASGRFVPAPAYASIQQYCIEHFDSWEPIPALTISLPGGPAIECSGGIQVADLGPQAPDGYIEISICGVFNPSYAQLFPQHMAAHYKNRASPSG